MNDEEKDSIEILNNTELDINTIDSVDLHTYNYAVKTVLNLIEKQQAEIEVYKDIKELADTEIKEILSWRYENKKLKTEIENLQKTIATYTAHTVCSDIKQSYKHKEDLEMLYKGCQIELEKKDKRISDLEFALMDMVLQFADENKDSINTMGLSALETAFNELNFDNPISIKEVHKRYKELAQKYYQ